MYRYSRLGFLFALLIVACIVVRVPGRPPLNDVRRAAFSFATECSQHAVPNREVLKFEDIKWRVIDDTIITVRFPDSTKQYLGLFLPKDSTILITKPLEYSVWANAHEAMHAIGFHEHPKNPFERCLLMPYQHIRVIP